MEYRPLKINVISAKDIKDMNMFSKQDVYAVVLLAGYPNSAQKTPVDKDCGTKPKWNHRMEFIVDEPYVTKPGLSLLFQLKAESAIRSDKDIGSVTVPIHELFKPDHYSDEKTVEFPVMTPSGQQKGKLKLAYSFGDKFTPQQQAETKKHVAEPTKHAAEPMMAYPAGPAAAAGAPYPGMGYPPQYAAHPPAPHAAYGGGYPAQPSGYGYSQPPPPGYGYPPAMPAGYAPGVYPPGHKPKKNKSGMGMGGLGLGLGAGLLGGLLVGEMASDIGDASAYADGYGDAMGDMGDF